MCINGDGGVKKQLMGLLVAATCAQCVTVALASDNDPEEAELTQQQVGMRKNLEDSTPASEQPDNFGWLLAMYLVEFFH